VTDTYDFGHAVFSIEGESRQFIETLKTAETAATKSVGTITSKFGAMNVSGQAVQQTFGVLGPAAGMMGGQFGQALGPISGMGSALSGLGSAMFGLPGIALAAVSAIGLLVSRIQRQRTEAREALEETRRLSEEARAIRLKNEEAASKTIGGVATSMMGSRLSAEQQRASASFARQEITARTEADRSRVASARAVYDIEQKILAAQAADRKLSREYREMVAGASPSSVLSEGKRKSIDMEYKYAKAKQSELIAELERLREATHREGVDKANKIERDAAALRLAELAAKRQAREEEHRKKVAAMFPAEDIIAKLADPTAAAAAAPSYGFGLGAQHR